MIIRDFSFGARFRLYRFFISLTFDLQYHLSQFFYLNSIVISVFIKFNPRILKTNNHRVYEKIPPPSPENFK